MISFKYILLATVILAQFLSLVLTDDPPTETPEQKDINQLKADVAKLQVEVQWLNSELAIPGLVWFLFLMFWVLLFSVIFIFYALRCRGRGLPGTNFFA